MSSKHNIRKLKKEIEKSVRKLEYFKATIEPGNVLGKPYKKYENNELFDLIDLYHNFWTLKAMKEDKYSGFLDSNKANRKNKIWEKLKHASDHLFRAESPENMQKQIDIINKIKLKEKDETEKEIIPVLAERLFKLKPKQKLTTTSKKSISEEKKSDDHDFAKEEKLLKLIEVFENKKKLELKKQNQIDWGKIITLQLEILEINAKSTSMNIFEELFEPEKDPKYYEEEIKHWQEVQIIFDDAKKIDSFKWLKERFENIFKRLNKIRKKEKPDERSDDDHQILLAIYDEINKKAIEYGEMQKETTLK